MYGPPYILRIHSRSQTDEQRRIVQLVRRIMIMNGTRPMHGQHMMRMP